MATQKQIDAYNAFLEKFPLEKLEKMEIDDFTNLKKDSFCYWLEFELDDLGSVKGGSSFKFGVYRYDKIPNTQKIKFDIKYDDKYAWIDELGKSYNEAYDKVREAVVRIANAAYKNDFKAIDNVENDILWPSIRWKIAFLYSEGELNGKKIIPIYGKEQLKHLAKAHQMPKWQSATHYEMQQFLFENKGNQALFDYSNKLWNMVPKKEKKIKDDNKIANEVLPADIVVLDEYMIGINEQLKHNHNIILHGAPGTGKTYLAKEIAKAMCGATDIKELESGGQFRMVQFHPSYDYTDFVEGLRPEDDGKGNIVFKRKDGVFKEFCKKAVNAEPITVNLEKERLKKAWNLLIEDIVSNNSPSNFKLKDKGYSTDINIEKTENSQSLNRICFKRQDGGDNGNYVRLDDILRLASRYPNAKSLANVENLTVVGEAIVAASNGTKTTAGCDVSKCWAVLMYLYSKYGNKQAPFIFLIDEINRGDMSKIFGELFYAIDPGYRGEDGKIDTQYQNLVTAKYKDENGYEHKDPFHKGFYVPDNVYIIGTMNDIDRSVESMDFAMRRRFQFIEVTAESRAEGMKLKYKKEGKDDYTETNAYKRMTNLNNCIISKEIGLSKAYQIGGSYFLSNQKDDKGNRIPIEGNFEDLWKYKLEGLLREYLRGEEENVIKDKLEKLHRAFGLDDEYKYNETTGEIEKMPKPDTGNNKTTTDE